MIRRSGLIGAALLLAGTAAVPAAGAPANPELSALVQGVNDEKARRSALRIETMDVSVRLHGTIAETVVTARFVNPGEDTLEGTFRLAMPAGSVVTGYALDVGDTMVDGVLADQRKARLAYETQVRREVDPGLGEVSRAYEFSTRVYPINPGSGRTIRIRFATPLDPGRGYQLPLAGDQEIGRLAIAIEASGGQAPPRVGLPAGAEARWRNEGGVHRLAFAAERIRPDGTLSIAAPEPAQAVLVSRHAGGRLFFQVEDRAGRIEDAQLPVRTAAILWDRSLSRADDDLDAEIALLQRYLDRVRPQAMDLLLFDSGGVERVRFTDAGALVARIRRTRYRGASSVAVLAGEKLSADACLLFSDGLVTIDRRDSFAPACLLFALPSAPDADRAWLGALAGKSGGELVDLRGGDPDRMLARLTRRVPRVVAVRSTSGAAVDFTRLESSADGWRIVGPMPSSGGLVVRLAGVGDETAERTYSPTGAPVDLGAAAALWAAEQVGIRAASDDSDRAELLDFARLYSVAGPEISFIVLEDPDDYAEADIEPPSTLPADQIRAFRDRREEIEEEEREEQEDRLEDLVEEWEEQKEWWETRFDPKAKPGETDEDGGPGYLPPPLPPPPPAPYVAPPPAPGAQPPTPPPAPPSPSVAGPDSPPEDAVDEEQTAGGSEDDGGDLLVTGSWRPGRGEGEGSIAIEPWAPDRPYLAAIAAAPVGARERVIAEQQRKHGTLPAFWLDVSEHEFRAGRRADALRLLLSALDLPTRNGETLAIVAERLMRYGEPDRAIHLFERLAALEPDRPHPLRSLALALAKRAAGQPPERARADLARAISLLTSLVMKPWPDEFDGIEMVALMEVNRLIAHYRRLGGEAVPLDPRLIALLDVDLRVVIEWSSDKTDLDLWVDEPNGERADYDNVLTAIGGHMSEDMTNGYGPEEYLLRHAPPGTYRIWADTFAADPLNPNGPSRITARLIRDYGRPTEQEEIVEVELVPRKEGDEDDEEDEGEDKRMIGRIRIRR